MSKVALGLEPLWENTFGKDWREAINAEKINEIYQQI